MNFAKSFLGPAKGHATYNRDRAMLLLKVSTVYFVTALILFPTIAANATNLIAGHTSDAYQALWSLWWVKYSLLTLHSSFYTVTYSVMYPIGFDTVFDTLSPIGGVLSIPLQFISLALAYNVLFFLGFIVTGLGAFVLCEYVTGDPLASFLGGFFFTFSAFHIAYEMQLHTPFFFLGFSAFFMYFVLRALDQGRGYRYAALAGAAFVLVVYMDEYEEGIMALLGVAIVLAVYLLRRDNRRRLFGGQRLFKLAAVGFVSAFALGSFGFVPLISTALAPSGLSAVNQQNRIADNIAWSANFLAFFVPNYYFYDNAFHTVAPNLLYVSDGQVAYVGLAALALALYGVYRERRRSAVWLILAVVMAWLALGPDIKFGNILTGIPGPFLLYHYVPLLNIIREPERFDIVVSLAIAVLAAIGAARLFAVMRSHPGTGTRRTYFATAGLCLFFLLETFGPSFLNMPLSLTTNTAVPHFIRQMAYMPGNFSVLVLPQSSLGNFLYSGMAQYYETAMQKPLVGGAITRWDLQEALTIFSMPLITQATYLATYNNQSYYTPPYASPIDENYTKQSLKTLLDYKTGFIVVIDAAYNGGAFDSLYGYLNKTFGEPVYADYNVTVFSTARALSGNLYTGFISYYEPDHWGEVELPNGSAWWTPTNEYGVVVTYAPYANGTAQVIGINATMRFDAVGMDGAQTLAVQSYPTTTDAHTTQILSVGPEPEEYTLSIPMVTGPSGNIVGFFDNAAIGGQGTVLISNITFSG